jgi:hemerythrin superfamily protein
MDAITLLKEDHKRVEQLFKRFEKAGDRAYVEKRSIVDRIIEELSVHAVIEEQLFYPVARATVPETEELALESLEEHHVVKWVLSELERMSPDDERFDAKVTVLMENVRHHVEEEENDFFPMVRDELGRNALSDLGDAMEAARSAAPTHPHPHSPDTPPANVVVGVVAGVVDRVRDTAFGVAQGGVAALNDLIALVLRRKRPSVSPTGSKRTRDAATQLRSTASGVTEAAIDAVRAAERETKRRTDRAATTARTTGRSAASGAKRTVEAAKDGAAESARAARAGIKGVATSAEGSAQQTATTAKRAATTTGRTARKAAERTGRTAKRSARKTSSTAKRSARSG